MRCLTNSKTFYTLDSEERFFLCDLIVESKLSINNGATSIYAEFMMIVFYDIMLVSWPWMGWGVKAPWTCQSPQRRRFIARPSLHDLPCTTIPLIESLLFNKVNFLIDAFQFNSANTICINQKSRISKFFKPQSQNFPHYIFDWFANEQSFSQKLHQFFFFIGTFEGELNSVFRAKSEANHEN